MFIAIGTGITLFLISLGGLTKKMVAARKLKKLKIGTAFECWGLNATQR